MNRYQEAGVDVTAGYELVKQIKKDVAETKRPGVLGALGSFGGLFDLGSLNYTHPVLVSGTDGVGTKLLLAKQAEKHTTIGIDCVAMCVNDILAQGAEPLYFLDYIATGKNRPAKMAQIVSGVATGCKQAGAALLGGETAEMPDMYAPDEYDLAGFSVGVVEKEQLLDETKPKAGMILLGLPSSGLHSNGYSLVRQILFKDHQLTLAETPKELGGKSLAEVLLEPTRIYVKAVLPLVKKGLISGISHITGGGLYENLPRMYADELQAQLDYTAWEKPAIFAYLAQMGELTPQDSLETFNMGLGLVLAVAPTDLAEVKASLKAQNERYFEIGKLVKRPVGAAKLVIDKVG